MKVSIEIDGIAVDPHTYLEYKCGHTKEYLSFTRAEDGLNITGVDTCKFCPRCGEKLY